MAFCVVPKFLLKMARVGPMVYASGQFRPDMTDDEGNDVSFCIPSYLDCSEYLMKEYHMGKAHILRACKYANEMIKNEMQTN